MFRQAFLTPLRFGSINIITEFGAQRQLKQCSGVSWLKILQLPCLLRECELLKS